MPRPAPYRPSFSRAPELSRLQGAVSPVATLRAPRGGAAPQRPGRSRHTSGLPYLPERGAVRTPTVLDVDNARCHMAARLTISIAKAPDQHHGLCQPWPRPALPGAFFRRLFSCPSLHPLSGMASDLASLPETCRAHLPRGPYPGGPPPRPAAPGERRGCGRRRPPGLPRPPASPPRGRARPAGR